MTAFPNWISYFPVKNDGKIKKAYMFLEELPQSFQIHGILEDT